MDMGKEVYAQKTDFIRLFWEKVVSDVSRWAWHTREQVINRKKPIFLKLARGRRTRGSRRPAPSAAEPKALHQTYLVPDGHKGGDISSFCSIVAGWLNNMV